jgi:mRNA interferase MazF
MPNPGDVVTYDFPGAQAVKRRPAVVVSSDLYHRERPDLILGLLTINVAAATTSSDYLLRDWAAAGLRAASAFRTFLVMASPTDVTVIGRLSNHDWHGVREAVAKAVA